MKKGERRVLLIGILNMHVNFCDDRFISFWATMFTDLKNAVSRKTRLKFWT